MTIGAVATRVAALTAALSTAAALLAGCAGGSDAAGSDAGNAGPPARAEADVRRAVTTHGNNVAWALGRTRPLTEDEVSAESCQGGSSDAYAVHGRFDVTATPQQHEGGLDRIRSQWHQLGWHTDSDGTGASLRKVVGRAPGSDSFQIAVERTASGFHIEVTSPCYRRSGG